MSNGLQCKRSVCLCEGRGKNPENVQRNDDVKAAVKRKEAAWKEKLGASDEHVKGRCMEAYKGEKINVKRFIYKSKNEVNNQFGRNMKQDVNGFREIVRQQMKREIIVKSNRF